MTERILKGRCFCGAVEYEVHDAFEYAGMCHCSDCRRVTGSGFKPFAGILRKALTVTKGDDLTMRKGKGDVYDVHCRICCSLLYSVVREGRYAHVAMGRSATIRLSGPPSTFSSLPKRHGSLSRTTFRNMRATVSKVRRSTGTTDGWPMRHCFGRRPYQAVTRYQGAAQA